MLLPRWVAVPLHALDERALTRASFQPLPQINCKVRTKRFFRVLSFAHSETGLDRLRLRERRYVHSRSGAGATTIAAAEVFEDAKWMGKKARGREEEGEQEGTLKARGSVLATYRPP